MESGDLTVASRAIVGAASTIGVFRPTGTVFNTSTSDQWLLRYSNTAGNPDVSFSYGAPGDIPVVGDWTGSGTATVGIFRPAGTPYNQTTGAQWLLRSSNTVGSPDIVVAYGGPGDLPVVGDWDGNGTTTIGVFRPTGTQFNQTTQDQWLLRNSNTAGSPDISLSFGAPGDQPVVGDWDGNRTTTIGVFRLANTPFNMTMSPQWLLRNSNTAGTPDLAFYYGAPQDIPITGDWDGNGTTTVGMFRPTGTPFNQTTQDQWLLRNSNSFGNPDSTFYYGGSGDMPVSGNWQHLPVVSGHPPMAPSQFTITSTDSQIIHFSVKDNNTAQTGAGASFELFEVVNGMNYDRLNVGIASFGGVTSSFDYVMNLTGGTHACLEMRAQNSFGASMFSNIACASGVTPPSYVNVGLGNGVLIASPDLTNMNYYPASGSPFRVWWQLCNAGTAASGALQVVLVETLGSGTQTSFNFPISGGLAPGQCVAQYTNTLTVTGSVNFDLYVNSAWLGGTGM